MLNGSGLREVKVGSNHHKLRRDKPSALDLESVFHKQTEGTMNVLVWILQILLALAFAAHGLLFLHPPASVVAQMNAAVPRWFQLFLGVAELLAAVGLTLPGLTRIKPILVPCAAVGIMIVMISATIFHSMRHEYSSAATTFVLLLVATFVAYMRFRVRPIKARA